jgi:tRNA(Ile)-lysidine synthase
LLEETDLARGDRVLVALSGGSDSTALVHVLAHLQHSLGFELFAHGIDHGLRVEAAAELAQAQALCTSLAVPFDTTRVVVPMSGNLQANARHARYAALDAAAATLGARWVATAHHADDRAETVLLRLLSGSGPAGLGVLPACTSLSATAGRLRPFIRSSKRSILAHLARHSLPYTNDPSNLDPRFLRVRVRRELLPLMEDLSTGAADRLNDLADALSTGALCSSAAQSASISDLPPVLDPRGNVIPLGRNQAQALRRALFQGQKGARVWLKGGLEVVIPHTAPVGQALHAVPRSVAAEHPSPRSPSTPTAERAEPSPGGVPKPPKVTI